MREPNKNYVYSLEDLTSEEWKQLTNSEKCAMCYYEYVEGIGWVFKSNENFSKVVVNAKELFYTLENIQVDCGDLTEEQIKEMADIFEKSGYNPFHINEKSNLEVKKPYLFLKLLGRNKFIVGVENKNKTTITYDKFMELFGSKEESKDLVVETSVYDDMRSLIEKGKQQGLKVVVTFEKL